MLIFLLCVMAYLLGSIPFALVIGKIFFNKDIRNMGSGNLGTTNMIRNFGKKAGLTVFFLDFSKGFISIYLANLILGDVNYLSVFGLFAIIGHIFPIFANFKGGKAVATSSSIFVYLYPLLALFLLIIFFTVLFLTGYVSLGSIIMALSTLMYMIFFAQGIDKYIIIAICILVIILHKSNIIRIKNGTENVSKLKINLKGK